MAGLPKRFAKMGFKKGWKAFRATKTGTKRAVRKAIRSVSSKKKRSKSVSKSVVLSSKPKRKRKVFTMAKKGSFRRRLRSVSSKGVVHIVKDAAIIGAGTLGGMVAINKTPWVNTRPSWEKALYLMAVGFAGIFLSKDQNVRRIASGVIGASVITAVTPMLPEAFRMSGRELTGAELAEIRGYGTMNKPMVSMGRPVNADGSPSMGYSRGVRPYAKRY